MSDSSSVYGVDIHRLRSALDDVLKTISHDGENNNQSENNNANASNNSSESIKRATLTKCYHHLLLLSMTDPTPDLFKFIREEMGDVALEYFREHAALSHLTKFSDLPKDVSSFSLADPPMKELEHWFQNYYLPDDEFWKTFHVSRDTFSFICTRVEDEIQELDQLVNVLDCTTFEEYVMKTVLLPLWYLTNADEAIDKCSEIFHIPLEIIEDELARGFALIIQAGNRMTNLTYKDLIETEQYFKENCRFPVVGAIGFQAFQAEDGQEIMTQFICNHKNEFIAVDTTFHTRVCLGLAKSKTLQNFIKLIPKGSYIAGFEEYSKYSQNTLKLLTPRDKDGERCTDTYNNLLKQVLEAVHVTLLKLIARFPKVCKLHKRMRDAIMAAFTLHNLCSFAKDEAPTLL